VFSRDRNRRALIRLASLISLSALIGWGCLEDQTPSPLPPLEEGISYDGGMYEPPSDPSSPEGYGYGSGYGSGSGSMSDDAPQAELEAGEEAP